MRKGMHNNLVERYWHLQLQGRAVNMEWYYDMDLSITKLHNASPCNNIGPILVFGFFNI